MKKIILVIVFSMLSFLSDAQLKIEWQKCFGGSQGEVAYNVSETHDGGFIVTGATNSNDGDVSGFHGDHDVWVIKTDIQGNLQWQKCLGGTNYDFGYSIIATSDGGYIMEGMTNSNDGDVSGNHGDWDIWLVKLDSLGGLQWQRCYGGTSLEEHGTIVEVSGGYVFIGSTASNDGDVSGLQALGRDPWLVKIDYSGNIIWQKCVYSQYDDRGHSVKPTTDGGYLISGDTYYWNTICHGEVDIRNIKVDSVGNFIEDYCRGGPQDDVCFYTIPTNDNGSIFVGRVLSGGGQVTGYHGGMFDIWVVKQDSSGTIEWKKCLGGSGEEDSFSIVENDDGSFLLTAFTTSVDGNINGMIGQQDMWVVKLDPFGMMLYSKCFGGTMGDQGESIIKTSDSKYVVAGGTTSNNIDVSDNHGGGDVWIVKLYENYNSITGNLFIDLNSNAVRDSGEAVIWNKNITETNTGEFTFSDPNGDYDLIVLDSGNFSVNPAPLNYYNAVPPFHSAYFAGINQIDSLNNFAFQPTGIFNDLCITITPLGGFRENEDAYYMINYENIGTTTLNGTVIFFPDNDVIYVSANPTATFVTTDSVVWNMGTLTPLQSGSILITVHVNPGTPIGTLINSNVRIEPVAGDANTVCNYNAYEVFVTAAVDPNAILVDRDTVLTTELPSPPYLNYIIYFQNTGNDTAFNVRVLNNIPPALDVNSFEFVASSHPVNIDYGAHSRLFTFNFDNILLPDSNVNEPASHGFIRYRIKPVSTLVAGDSIKNNAAIYFDFNQPVITNSAVTEIVLPTGEEGFGFQVSGLWLFPNPARDELIISSRQLKENATIRIYDLFGREVFQLQTRKLKPETKINVSGLAKGIYLIEINSAEKIYRGKFIKE